MAQAGNTSGRLAPRKALQYVAAGITFLLVAAAWWRHWWPFTAHPRELKSYAHPSAWQLIFSDRATLGFVRLVVAGLAIYVAVSVPALAVADRWLRGFGTGGLTADDAEVVSKTIEEYREEVNTLKAGLQEATEQTDNLRHERDELRDLLRRFVRNQRTSTTSRVVGGTTI